MLGLSTAQVSLWAATFAMEAALFLFLLHRRQYRDFPFFAAYILGVLSQNALLFFSYSHWGFEAPQSGIIAWASQGFVMLLRALVALELCHRLVGRYAGIWALTWRVLAAFATVILAYCLLQPGSSIPAAIVSAHRGLELTIATVVVVLFFFANYYGIIPHPRVKFRFISGTLAEIFLQHMEYDGHAEFRGQYGLLALGISGACRVPGPTTYPVAGRYI
jgi:hypothetical protein